MENPTLVCKCRKKILNSLCTIHIAVNSFGKAEIIKAACSKGESFRLKHVSLIPKNEECLGFSFTINIEVNEKGTRVTNPLVKPDPDNSICNRKGINGDKRKKNIMKSQNIDGIFST